MITTTTDTDTTVPTADLIAGFNQIRDEVKLEVFERTDEIDGALLTFIAGTTSFTKGLPGIAKTMLPERIGLRIDAEGFLVTFSSFTQPEELFGPVSLKALEDDRFERQIQGTLVTADWAILDEIWKSNRVLNMLLRILNERQYKHGNAMIKVPLSAVFAMSNEWPEDEGLAALSDRLLRRAISKALRQPSNFMKMLDLTVDPAPATVLTWAQVQQAQREAATVKLPTAVLEAVVSIRKELANEQILPSDRRFRESMKLVRAAAWLDGCPVAEIEHLAQLAHTLWFAEEQIERVAEVVSKVANPEDKAVKELLAGIESIEDDLEKGLTPDVVRTEKATELFSKVRRAIASLDTLTADATPKRLRQLGDTNVRLAEAGVRVLVDWFDADPDEATKMIAKDLNTN
jgi:MoxR-like ATPase